MTAAPTSAVSSRNLSLSFGQSPKRDVDQVPLRLAARRCRKPKPGQVALASVGAAVEQLVRSVAPEIAPKRINVVSPGIIDTPMFGPESKERTERLQAATATNLVTRPGVPEVAALPLALSIIGSALSFLLVFRLSWAFNRWSDARSLMGATTTPRKSL